MGPKKKNSDQIKKINRIFTECNPTIINFLKENGFKFKVLDIHYIGEENNIDIL